MAQSGLLEIQAASSSRPFLINSWVDAAGVLGGGVLLSACFYAAWKAGPAAFVIASSLFAMFSDLPHVLQTPARILLDPQERGLHGTHYCISLLVAAVSVAVLLLTGRFVVLLVIWVFWQFLHVLKQHYGMIAIYAAKAGYRGSRRLVKYALIAGCVAPFIYRLRQGMSFADYVLMGHRMPFSGLAIPTPMIPLLVVAMAYALFLALAVIFFIEQWRISRRSGTTLPPMVLGTFAIAIASYNISYLLVSDLYVLILIATSVHSLQYHLISWRRNNGRFARPLQGDDAKLFLARISRPKSVWIYATFFACLGLLVANGEIVWFGAIPITLVIHHFYMDGFIWKTNRNPTLALDLGLVKSKV